MEKKKKDTVKKGFKKMKIKIDEEIKLKKRQ